MRTEWRASDEIPRWKQSMRGRGRAQALPQEADNLDEARLPRGGQHPSRLAGLLRGSGQVRDELMKSVRTARTLHPPREPEVQKAVQPISRDLPPPERTNVPQDKARPHPKLLAAES
ncbi:hypothetical protein C8Q78DRAFT_432052 [Trametes maxima]|nr:hypothetical protein C8Q78DRAFT_432052 [Trametes maxima]